MGFHAEGVGRDSTPEVSRERKLERVRAGTAHAALVFDGDDCLGWCQFGEPAELPRIKSRAAYERGRQDPPDWRIGCCCVGRGTGARAWPAQRWPVRSSSWLVAAQASSRAIAEDAARWLPGSSTTARCRRESGWA